MIAVALAAVVGWVATPVALDETKPITIKSATPAEGATITPSSSILFQVKTDDVATSARVEARGYVRRVIRSTTARVTRSTVVYAGSMELQDTGGDDPILFSSRDFKPGPRASTGAGYRRYSHY